MKKNIFLWMSALVLTIAGLSSCSSSDDDIKTEDLIVNNTDITNGWVIQRDESDRVTYVRCFTSVKDPKEKLYSCPSSFDEIKHLFPLSEGNEIRLENKGEFEPFEGLPEFRQYYETYSQYYKGLLVLNSGARFYYFITPKGKRLSYGWTGPFKDIKDLDTTPSISEQDARQVLADNLGVDRDDSWRCSLYIREFSSKKEGLVVRDQRLVYLVEGPYAPGVPNVHYAKAPQYTAFIDAHTGELVSI